MRIVLVGSGGVGDAFARIAARRDFFEHLVVADYDPARAERTVAAVQERHPGEGRFVASQVDASEADSGHSHHPPGQWPNSAPDVAAIVGGHAHAQ